MLPELQIYQEDDLDVLSGLKAKTKPGRPDWKTVSTSTMHMYLIVLLKPATLIDFLAAVLCPLA